MSLHVQLTDGAPSVLGHHCRFLIHLKEKIPNTFTINYILIIDNIWLQNILVMNYLKASPLNNYIFWQIFHENE